MRLQGKWGFFWPSLQWVLLDPGLGGSTFLPLSGPVDSDGPNGKTRRPFCLKLDVERYPQCWKTDGTGSPGRRKKQDKSLTCHWLKYPDVKASLLKYSERVKTNKQKTKPPIVLINRRVSGWNYFKMDAFLNCIQNTFRGSYCIVPQAGGISSSQHLELSKR